MKFCIVFILLLLMTTALFACSPSDRFSAGKPVSREELSEIAAGIFNPETSADETETESETVILAAVYWTRNGKAYHTDPDCRYIQGSADIQSGTLEESGKEKPCSACQKRLQS